MLLPNYILNLNLLPMVSKTYDVLKMIQRSLLFLSIFRYFFDLLHDLGWIFVDFRKILRRFSFAPRATKAQNRISKRSRAILTARLGPCLTQSLRTARTSFEKACECHVFNLLSLRTHKPTKSILNFKI